MSRYSYVGPVRMRTRLMPGRTKENHMSTLLIVVLLVLLLGGGGWGFSRWHR